MTSGCMPRGVKVAPLSKQSIKQKALIIRDKIFKLPINQSIDLSRGLEHRLHELGVVLEVWEIADMPDVEALTNPDAMTIILREDTYDALCNKSDPKHYRARFTVAHEIGHLILHEGFALARGAVRHEHYEDSEWQADAFAAELLMPSQACINLSIAEIRERFQVGFKAARNKFNSLK
ncbi:ImmA/IrrE family metallo-endopeptidase [Acinetobacter soli]|uniref:ImmA/IrrE family metallo-endopeptidase n=1 Tax=Acinetobacter soli TaxID=487316 RepID=UPI000E5B6E60|nr:ImmA/IrrE family metallo-endopeptidase [Acinetobacter soli]